MAKNDIANVRQVTIDAAHTATDRTKTIILQRGRNVGHAISLLHSITRDSKHVQFRCKPTIVTFYDEDDATMLTYDSGADRHYLSEKYRKKLGLPILRVSAKKVGVKNGGACNGKYVTRLPFTQLSNKVAEADKFEEFPTSLMSVGKTANNGNVSIFTKEGVTVYKEEDILITCQRKPILLGKQGERSMYRIPLTQDHGQWQPRKPRKKSKKYFQQTNSVYILPSIEDAIKWIHTVCRYPVKSTWIKAINIWN